MCGRFTLFDNKDILENEFEVDIQGKLGGLISNVT